MLCKPLEDLKTMTFMLSQNENIIDVDSNDDASIGIDVDARI